MTAETANDQHYSVRWLGVLRRRWWIILVCVVVATAAAFLRADFQQKLYPATAGLLFQQDGLSQQLFGYSTSSAIDPATADATNLSLVTQETVAAATAQALGIPVSRVQGEISANAVASSDIVDVTATDPSPAAAARIANVYAAQFIAYRQSADRAQVIEAATELQQQISRLSATGGTAASQLVNLRMRLSQLEVLKSLQTGDVQLSQKAQVPTAASSPKTKRDTAIGLLVGLLLGLLAAGVAERLDQRVRDADEVGSLVSLPVLGAIPSSRGLSRAAATKTFATGPEAETFRLLRTQLRYFNVDRAIRSVLISSAAPGDGKTTVAWNLAVAAATGARGSSVLLVDADLRAPRIPELARLSRGPGLAEVLTHDLDVDDAIRSVAIKAESGDRIAELDVLTSGGVVPNPLELLESNSLRELISALHDKYGFIVFDAPPTTLVPDAIPLMSQVSGLLLVVRLRQTSRTALTNLSRQLSELNAHPLGVVLNDVRARTSYYGYEYGAANMRANGSAVPAGATSVPDAVTPD